jgi:Tfp pilus assembly protein PilF
MTAARMVLAIGLVATCAAGCHAPTPSPLASGQPARGDVTRNTAAARAETDRALRLIGQQKFAEAEPVLQIAIENDPSYGPAHNNLGLVYYQLGRLYDAAWEFQNAIKLLPNEPQPHNNLGLVLESALKLKEAEAAYTEAHRLAPQHPEYAGNLARVRIRLGERDEETRRLLQIVILTDTRPDWVDWAKSNLTRLRPPIPDETEPTTPTTRPPP